MTRSPSFFSRSTYAGRQAYRDARRLTREDMMNYRTQIAMAIAAVCVIVALPWELRIFMVVAILMAQDYDWSELLSKFQEARRDRRAHQNIQEDTPDNNTRDTAPPAQEAPLRNQTTQVAPPPESAHLSEFSVAHKSLH